MNVLVTGGAGFIGLNLVKALLGEQNLCTVTVLDAGTYAAHYEELERMAREDARLVIERCYLGHPTAPITIKKHMHEADEIIHLAAETHVDRAVDSADAFLRTNVMGTWQMLEAARVHARPGTRFYHMSTDEVYGPVPAGVQSEVTDRLNPRNPYSASKAAAEHLAMSYFHTHGLPVVVGRFCNIYGPWQQAEKFIPVCILQCLRNEPIPIYGDGQQERQWMYVADAVWEIIKLAGTAEPGTITNVPGNHSECNRVLACQISTLVAETMHKKDSSGVFCTTDRPGHDRRYHIGGTINEAHLPFGLGIRTTVEHYRHWQAYHLERQQKDGTRARIKRLLGIIDHRK